MDIIKDPLPKTDMIFCRDVLVHFSYADIERAIRNIQAAGIKWLAMTNFPDKKRNRNIPTGAWRPLNFERALFHFPPPLMTITEGCTEGEDMGDKSIAVWAVSELELV